MWKVFYHRRWSIWPLLSSRCLLHRGWVWDPFWDPDKPVYENEAYVARAKELKQELESTMLSSRTGEALDGEETQSEEGKAEG